MKKIILFLIMSFVLGIVHCSAQYPEYAVGVQRGLLHGSIHQHHN